LPDGSLLTIDVWDNAKQGEYPHAKAFPTRIVKLSPDSKVLWSVPLPAHHELRLLPGGQILTLTERNRRIQKIDRRHLVVDNGIAWLSPHGKLLREISLYDIVRRSRLITLHPVKPNSFHLVDLFHSNAISRVADIPLTFQPTGKWTELYAPDNLVLSSRHQNFVAIISPKKRKLIWAWGQGTLSGPHSGRMLPSGDILVFDNGLGRGFSRVVEVDPRTNRIVWQYQADHPADFYSGSGGAVQRLANGDTLVTDAWKYTVFEVTPEGRVVWRFVSPGRSFLYRLHRYDERYFTPAVRSSFEPPERPSPERTATPSAVSSGR